MSVLSNAETTELVLDGDQRAAVLLFAGGTTGLVLLASSELARRSCGELAELAEAAGLSALVFAEDIPGDAALAAARGADLLTSLGVEQSVLVALGIDAVPALRAARSTFAALVLVAPVIPRRELEALLAEVPIPKLVFVCGSDAAAQQAAAGVFRYAIGPLAIRHLPANCLLTGEEAVMVAETLIAFAAGACGGGRHP